MSRILLILTTLLFITLVSYGQCPTVSFTLPDEVCKNQNYTVTVDSEDSVEYSWDFCSGDLSKNPDISVLSTVSGARTPTAIVVAKEGESWYGFLSSRDNNRLYRLDFVDGLNSSPVFQNLGSLDGVLNGPKNLELIYENGLWYGLLINYSSSELVRLSFGSSLQNTPTAESLGGLGVLNRPRGLSVDKDNGVLIATITNDRGQNVALVNFGNSVTNSSLGVLNTRLPFTRPLGLDIVKDCGKWIGLVTSLGQSEVYKLDFGQTLYSTPTISKLTDIPNPTEIKLFREGGKYQAFVSTASSSDLYRMSFSEAVSAESMSVDNLGNFNLLNNTFGFFITKEQDSKFGGFAVSYTENKIFRIEFPDECSAIIPELTTGQSIINNYGINGTYLISGEAVNNDGNTSLVSKSITVRDQAAPNAVSFSVNSNSCVTNELTFLASESPPADVTYLWDFGDGTIVSGGQSMVHKYRNEGEYFIKLISQKIDGCENFSMDTVLIFNELKFSFNTDVVCTNTPVTFINSNQHPNTDAIAWRWSINGQYFSGERNPVFTFDTPGTKLIALEATLPACSLTLYDTTFVVEQGPVVSFDVAQVCERQAVTFTNQTTGEGTTGYTWDFGDGGSFASATAESPSYTFDDPGTYLVSLSVTNELGCQNVYRQEVTVYEQPSVGFVSEVACVGTPTQFTDTTTAGTNANVIEWEWSFGDGGTANERNPAHTYSQPGTYEVQLITQTTAGCLDSAVQTVTVESPVAAGFVATAQCPTVSADYRTRLSDTSVVAAGDKINRWFWTIGNASFVTQNVEYSFPGPGTYPVTLTAFAASGCASTVTRSVVVDSLPAVAFTHPVACTGEPVVFQSEVSAGLTDYRWSFGEVGTAFEANPSFVFDTPGTYAVILSAQTTAGCPFTTTQSVTVTAAPVAAFEASATQGGAPLTVSFTNQSTDATQYAWDFGHLDGPGLDGPGLGTSEELNPTFTFDEVGTYEVTLTATNAVGCVSTAAQTITVRDPVQDLRLEEISVVDNPNGAGQRLLLSVRNVGSLPADSVAIVIGFGDAVSVQEDLLQPLLAGETRVYVTQFILPKTPGSVRYLCATLTIGDTDFIDASPADNRNCVSLDEQLSTEAPFPNPVRDQLQLPVILPQGDAVSLRLMDSRGQTMRTYRQANAPAGLNTFVIPTKGLPVGTYLLQMTYRGEQRQWRVGVAP